MEGSHSGADQLELTERSFDYPEDFKAEDYFDDCFGIIADQKVKVETVKLKVSAGQANYLRSLTDDVSRNFG